MISHNWNLDTKGWLKENLQCPESSLYENIPWQFMFVSIVWNIWKCRNKEAFEGISEDPSQTKRRILHFAREVAASFISYLVIPTPKTIKFVSWLPPPAGTIKINTDGSAQPNANRFGYGGSIRTQSGSWITGYYGSLHPCTSLESELQAILAGLELTQSKGWANVAVETDSKTASELTKCAQDESHPVAALMEDIKLLITRTGCSLQHILREGNACAHYLAAKGAAQDEAFVEMTVPDENLKILLGLDSRGVAYPRV